MKVGFKKKRVFLAAFFGIVFQIVSLKPAKAMEYEAAVLVSMDRRMFRTESLYSIESPFSWSCCFTWRHNVERADDLPTQDTKNALKDKTMAPSDWASFSYYYPPYHEIY
jgi:hypothetical protein